MTKQEHAYRAAIGGFWISPEGVSYPVTDACEHYDTAEAIRGRDTGGTAGALDAGWVRITYCCQSEFCCEWYAGATVAALRTAAVIARHEAGNPCRTSFLAECIPFANHKAADTWRRRNEWAPAHEPGNRWKTAADPQAADKLARYVIQKALEKSAAENAKEPEMALEMA